MAFRASADPIPAFLSEDRMSARADLILLNTSAEAVSVYGFGWSAVTEGLDEEKLVLQQVCPGGPLVGAGETYRQLVDLVLPDGELREGEEGLLCVFHSHGRQAFQVRFVPFPQVTTYAASVSPILGDVEQVDLAFDLFPGDLVAESVQMLAPWADVTAVERTDHGSHLARCRVLGQSHLKKGTYAVAAAIAIKGTSRRLAATFIIEYSLRSAGAVTVDGLPRRLHEGSRVTVVLNLRNPGDEPLTVEGVDLEAPQGACVLGADHLVGTIVTPRGELSSEVTLDLSGVQPGEHSVSITMRCAEDLSRALSFTAPVDVEGLPLSPTPVAFDFGTSTSCAAAFNRTTGAPTCVEGKVEVGEGRYDIRRVFPSRLRFRDDPSSTELGRADVRVTDRRDGLSVEHLKLGLCNNADLVLDRGAQGRLMMDPGSVTGLYLRLLYQYVRQYTGLRFDRFIGTVPTKYGEDAVARFRQLLVELGARDVMIQDEAIAACVYFVRKGKGSQYLKRLSLPERYLLVLVDVGGGTTDISLMQVVDTEGRAGRRRLGISVRGVTGRKTFGGVYFNERFRDYWLRRADETAQSAGYRLPESVDVLESDDQQMYYSRISALTNAVEQAKCRLFEQSPTELALPADTYHLAVNPDDPGEGITWPDALAAPDAWSTMANEDFDELLGHDLDDIAHEIKGMARRFSGGENGVACVILVGQSTRLPTVRRKFTEHFGSERCVALMDEDAKTCVALGALEFYRLAHNPGDIDFEFRDLRGLTPARLGLLWSGRYGSTFREIIPVGTPLPAEGEAEISLASGGTPERMVVEVYWNYGAKDDFENNENLVHVGTFGVPEREAELLRFVDDLTFSARLDARLVCSASLQCPGGGPTIQLEELRRI